MVKLLGVIIVVLFMTLLPMKTFADSYNVTAVVHAPLPADLPIVSGPTNTNQENSGVYVSGTCTVIVPTIIVVLVRDSQTIGSGNCSADGKFSIFVGLVLGTNTIYPKFLTVTGLSSGYGVPISITYELKKLPAKEQPKSNEADTPNGEALVVNFDYDFVSYDNHALTKLKYTVQGGKAPYDVVISWGDNSQKKYQAKASGEQNIEHKYKKILPPSQITIQVTDARGIKTIQSRALVSFRGGAYIPPAPPVQDDQRNWLPVWFIGVGSFSAILLLRHYQHIRYIKLKTKTKQIKSSKKR